MTRRMVSGPDLGAGFLWQLSTDGTETGRDGAFTFHAQEGGEDASGPPVGPPDFLTYRHPEVACMFGGPRCWERTFELPPDHLAEVRTAYQRTRLMFSALLAHEYEGRTVPFAEGTERFLAECDGPLRAAGIPYHVVGRGASWLAEGGEPPRRLLIEVRTGGAELIGARLASELIEPVAPRGPEEGLGGRAFLGTVKAGLLVDFGERPPGAGGAAGEVRELAYAGFLVPVAVGGPVRTAQAPVEP